MRYRWHRYVIKWCKNNFLFSVNLLNKSIIKINIKNSNDIIQTNYFDFDEASQDHLNLRRLNFVVPINISDYDLLANWFNKFCLSTKVLEVVIIVTYKCNFHCTYCYQESKIARRPAVHADLEHIKEWLNRLVEYRKPTLLRITFFGGEPLLFPDSIRNIAAYVSNLSRKFRFECRFDLITNGYLLDTELLKTINDYNIQKVQITLDGPPFVHDKRRIPKNGKESFFNIFQNILHISAESKARVVIRTNIDKQNVCYYPQLLDLLSEKNLSDRIELSIVPTKKTIPCLTHCALYCFDENEIVKYYLACLDQATERGFFVTSGIEIGPCMAISKGSFVLCPDGSLYKCTNLVGHSEFKIGNIYEEHDMEKYDRPIKSPWKQCVECSYVPICAGGCRYQALSLNGDIRSKICRKEMFDKALPLIYSSRIQYISTKNDKLSKLQ